MAELAACKAMGIYWGNGVNTFHVPDSDELPIEVRFSNSGYLKVRRDDYGVRVVAVSGDVPTFRIQGWIDAEEAKVPEWRKAPRNDGPFAYFVPYEKLQSAETLIEWARNPINRHGRPTTAA